jgi:hypothetical protein
MTGYDLSRQWFDFCFANPEKIKPAHTAVYFFAIEHCNRLGWKKKFGLPTTMAMEAVGISSYNTYKSVFTDLIEWGFIEIIEYSKNQYSSNIVALSNFNKAPDKALDEALMKHSIKHGTKQSESTVSIDKPYNQEPLNNKTIKPYNHPEAVASLFSFCSGKFNEKYLNEKTKKMFDLLLSTDNYVEQQIKAAITFGINDDFWKKQFISPMKLRNKDKNDVTYIDKFLNLSKYSTVQPQRPMQSVMQSDLPR